MTNELGVDMSSNQAGVNYTQLKAAVNFCYLRVYRSNGEVDPMWRKHHDGMTGKLRAPYLFARDPKIASVTSQVSQFLKDIGGSMNAVAWELPAVLDMEYDGVSPNDIRNFIAEVREQTGENNVYVYLGYANYIGRCSPWQWCGDSGMRMIVARYYSNSFATAFSHIPNHPNLDIVQYWNAAVVKGIPKATDVNNARRLVLRSKATSSTPSKSINTSGVADMELSTPIPDNPAPGTVGRVMRDLELGHAGVNSAGALALDIVNATHEAALTQAAVAALAQVVANQTSGGTLTAEDIQEFVDDAVATAANKIAAALTNSPATS